MSNPTENPTVTSVPTPEEVVAAAKFARTKSLAKKTLTRVGVPVLIGATAAYVVSRKNRSEEPVEDDSFPEE